MRKLIFLSLIFIQFIACKSSIDKINNDAVVAETIIPINSIPIEYNELICIKASIDNIKSNFIIDSGADWFCLDSTFHYSNCIKKYNYKKFNVSGVGNSAQNVSFIMDSLFISLGINKNYFTRSVPVVNLKSIGGDIVDGLIGTDFLENRIIEVNFEKEYIRFFISIDNIDISKYKRIEMKIINYRYYIPLTVRVNDSITIKGYFMIDTGSPTSDLTSSVAERYDLINKIEHKVHYYSKYGGVGGESSGYEFIVDSLQISDYFFGGVIMSFSSDESGIMADEEYIGIIGNNILERFDLIFDFKNNNLYLKPNENINAPFIPDKLGFYYVDRCKTMGGWLVKGFYENSSAEKQGLKTDDKIISVNGIPVEKISSKDQKDFFIKLDKVKFVVKRAEDTKTIEINLSPLL